MSTLCLKEEKGKNKKSKKKYVLDSFDIYHFEFQVQNPMLNVIYQVTISK